MTTAPSWQDLYDLGRATLQARRPKLIVLEGDVTDAVLAGAATMASTLVAYASGRFLSAFLDGAAGDDLTDLARDRGVERDLGDSAVGVVTLARVSFSVGAGTISAGFRVASEPDSTGAFSTFTTDVDVVFGPTDLTKSVNATCTKVGTQGNVDSGTVDRTLDTMFDPSITVINGARFAGGSAEESDSDLRDRVRGFFLTLARGTIDALAYGAKTVPGVKRVNVIPDYDTGIVTVYVSDADGNANTAMTDAVYTELQTHWAAAGDVLNVVGAVLVIEAIDVSLTVRTGIDINALLDRIRQAIIARVARLNPGETLYRDMISAAVRDVDRENILTVVVNTPAANVVPSTGQVIRTNTSSVTFS